MVEMWNLKVVNSLRGHKMITLMKDEFSWMSRDNMAIFGVALTIASIEELYQKSEEEPFLWYEREVGTAFSVWRRYNLRLLPSIRVDELLSEEPCQTYIMISHN
jgi:hypothetical protein